MKTFFASPERATKDEIQVNIEMVSNNPLMDSLLKTVSGKVGFQSSEKDGTEFWIALPF